MNWTVEKAEKNFSGLLLEAGYKPQPVFDNNQLIAAVIDAKTFREFERWQNQRKRKSLASAFEELRQLWQKVQQEKRMLITTDKGFAKYRNESHHGILIIRLKQPDRLLR